MKFYPSDWRADPALRSCTIAARGLWVEMLCLMHEAEPYGSLLIKSQRIDKKRLASLCGISEKECIVLLLELEGFGVFERDLDGTIYSRRMRRDHAKAEEGRKQVAKRWNGEKPDRLPNRSPKPETGCEAITPEARSQIPEPLPSVAERADDRVQSKSKKRAMALPSDWVPSQKAYALAEQFGQNVQIVEGIFRDYVASSGKLYADHDAAFHNFIRNQNSFNRGGNNGKTQDNPRAGSIIGALDRAIQAVEAEPDFALPADNLLRISQRSV